MQYDDLFINVFFNTLIFHLNYLVKVHRQFTTKPKLINPWTFTNHVFISYDVVIKWLAVLNRHSLNYYISWESVSNKKGDIKSIVVKFSHYGVLRYHLAKVLRKSKSNIDELLTKKWGDGSYVNVVCRESCPVIFEYKLSSGKFVFSGSYELYSESGQLML